MTKKWPRAAFQKVRTLGSFEVDWPPASDRIGVGCEVRDVRECDIRREGVTWLEGTHVDWKECY